jgi:hypothetical protein
VGFCKLEHSSPFIIMINLPINTEDDVAGQKISVNSYISSPKKCKLTWTQRRLLQRAQSLTKQAIHRRKRYDTSRNRHPRQNTVLVKFLFTLWNESKQLTANVLQWGDRFWWYQHKETRDVTRYHTLVQPAIRPVTRDCLML